MGTVGSDAIVNVIVREVMSGSEMDLELPLATTGREIIETLLSSDVGIYRVDPSGTPYTFKLTCKETGDTITDIMTLQVANVKEGYTLLLTPSLVAGRKQ